jgi:hypothetical protein
MRMRIFRKFNTEISLLEHGDFNSIECVNEGNYSLAKDSTIRNLTIFFDLSGVQGLKIYTDKNTVTSIGSLTSLYQYTYNYELNKLIGFSSTKVTKPINGILTLTPVEWTSDPCPALGIPVTPAVVPPIIEVTVSEPNVVGPEVVSPPIIEVTVSEPNVVEPEVVSDVGSDSANPEEVQEPQDKPVVTELIPVYYFFLIGFFEVILVATIYYCV